MNAVTQLSLFGEPSQYAHLYGYWRGQIYGEERNEHGCKVASWFDDVFRFRHARNTTGWSMATSQGFFAHALFDEGQLDAAEFARLKRFEARVKRWDKCGETGR